MVKRAERVWGRLVRVVLQAVAEPVLFGFILQGLHWPVPGLRIHDALLWLRGLSFLRGLDGEFLDLAEIATRGLASHNILLRAAKKVQPSRR